MQPLPYCFSRVSFLPLYIFWTITASRPRDFRRIAKHTKGCGACRTRLCASSNAQQLSDPQDPQDRHRLLQHLPHHLMTSRVLGTNACFVYGFGCARAVASFGWPREYPTEETER